MPQRRLILPRGLPGANDLVVPGAARPRLEEYANQSPGGPALVVLAVPSVEHLLVSSWSATVRRKGRAPFSEWLEAQAGPLRYEVVLRAWADVVGVGPRSGHEFLVLTGDRVERLLGALPETATLSQARRPAPGRRTRGCLDSRGVQVLDALLGDLRAQARVGPVAGELVDAVAQRLPRTTRRPRPRVGDALARTLTARTTAARDALVADGITVHGDPEALVWGTAAAGDDVAEPAGLPVAEGAAVAAAVLERTLLWSSAEPTDGAR